MERSLRVSGGHARLDSDSTVSTADAASRQPVLTTAVGASYAFDPGVDGLAGIYAARVLERGSIRARSAPRSAPTAWDSSTGVHNGEHYWRGPAPHASAGEQPRICAAGVPSAINRRGAKRGGKRTTRPSHEPAQRSRPGFRSAGRASSRRQDSPPSSCYPSASSSRTPRTPRCSLATSCSPATRLTASPPSLASIRPQFSPLAPSRTLQRSCPRDHRHPGPGRISRGRRLEREPAGGHQPVRVRRP